MLLLEGTSMVLDYSFVCTKMPLLFVAMNTFVSWWQALPVFIFANQAGLDMLETTLVSLQDIALDKIFDDSGRKALFSEFAKIMQEVTNLHIYFNIFKNSIYFLPLILVFTHVRDLLTCPVEFAHRQWGGTSRTNKPSCGRSLPQKRARPSTASLSLSSTGHSFKIPKFNFSEEN